MPTPVAATGSSSPAGATKPPILPSLVTADIPVTNPDSPVMSKNLSFKVREKGALEPLHLPRGLIKSFGSEGSGRSATSAASPRGDGPSPSSARPGSFHGSRSPRALSSPAIKANTDPKKRFSGRWESLDVEGLDAFLAELGLSAKFKRLSDRFASASSVLTIEQEGDLFSIEDSNDLREMLTVFVVGTPFESESEKGEEVVVTCSWTDDGKVLTTVAAPKANATGASVVMVRRWIEEDKLVQTSQVVGSNAIARRVYSRTR